VFNFAILLKLRKFDACKIYKFYSIQLTDGVLCSASSECKLVLWWFKIIELCLRQIDFGAEHRRVIKVLLAIIPALMSFGEDKSSAGLLGAIGLGRRSPLSFRLHTSVQAAMTVLATVVR